MKLQITRRQRENLSKALIGLMTVNAAGFVFNPKDSSLPTIVFGCIFIFVSLIGMLWVDR